MEKKIPAPKAAEMKWAHEVRVGRPKLMPCDGVDRVRGERCLVVKRKESEATCIADESIRTLRKRQGMIVTAPSSICVHFYHALFIS